MKATAEITNKTVTTPLQRDREGHCRDTAKRFVTVVLLKNLKKKINRKKKENQWGGELRSTKERW